MRLIAVMLAVSVFAPGLASVASADHQIVLLDKTKIVGKVVHFYDGMLTIQVPSGAKMKLPATKVRSIDFKLPKPRATLSSPKKSFSRLRKAALKGDLDTYVDSHSAYYQMYLNHQVAMVTPRKFVKRLRKEWGDVQLTVLNTKVKGDVAVMKVRRRQGDDAQEGEMRFVKENSEWKMILPL